eukprot:CAMPEP_0185761184 /NCGR_PEP_ID=MMETSP1174-20130828/20096_1 /TAXON_ID=35687 /ORGANISM="Dictyocha speculum, Strain CCMP1381" /LENGTH=138 /DNA_ID=CAMNT_0028442307 /DNA_START=232 /DNA_END=649 /DNA_ORIENTATION=-
MADTSFSAFVRTTEGETASSSTSVPHNPIQRTTAAVTAGAVAAGAEGGAAAAVASRTPLGDARGLAVHEILIDLVTDQATVFGMLATGQAVEYSTSDPLVGMVTSSGWWVKAKRKALEDPYACRYGSYLLTALKVEPR